MTNVKPKKAISPYFAFLRDKRASYKEEHPELNAKQLVSALGKAWNNLDDDTKSKYVKESEKDKARYTKEMESYVPDSDSDEANGKGKGKKNKSAKNAKKSKKAVKKEGQPKKAMSAYFFYIGERRKQLKSEQPNLGNKEIVIAMGKEWGQLDDKVKAKYNDMAKKDKVRYAKEMDIFNKKNDENDDEDEGESDTKEENEGTEEKSKDVEEEEGDEEEDDEGEDEDEEED